MRRSWNIYILYLNQGLPDWAALGFMNEVLIPDADWGEYAGPVEHCVGLDVSMADMGAELCSHRGN